MARYRKIDTRIWNDAKFTAMSDSGKLVFLFLLTHPHMTSLGAMRATLPGLASELGWQPKAFAEAFREALRKGLVEHDSDACFVGLPKFLKYNGPESPNVVKSWADALDLIPECGLKALLAERVKGFVEGLSKGFAEALPEAFRKTMPNQEQEQEQEPEQEQDTPKAPKGACVYPSGFEAFWALYPKKLGKDKALKAWVSAGKRVKADRGLDTLGAMDVLNEAAAEFAKSEMGRGDYCPHPATWLNGGRWNDDRAEWNRVRDASGKPSKPELFRFDEVSP